MKPTVAEVLTGPTAAIMTTMPPEAGPEYLASRVGMVASLNAFAAMEAETGIAVRVEENAAIRQVLQAAFEGYDEALGGALSEALAAPDADLTWSGLDARNADLRRALIALHEAAEDAGDRALDHLILRLYRDMARLRRLELPAALG